MKIFGWMIALVLVGGLHAEQPAVNSRSITSIIKQLDEAHNYEFIRGYINKGLSPEKYQELIDLLMNRAEQLREIRDNHLRNYYALYVGMSVLTGIDFWHRSWQIQETTYWPGGNVKSIDCRTSKRKILAGAVCFLAGLGALDGYLADILFKRGAGDKQLKRIDELLALLNDSKAQ